MQLFGRREAQTAESPVDSPAIPEVLSHGFNFRLLTNPALLILTKERISSPEEYIHRKVPAKIFNIAEVNQIPSMQYIARGLETTRKYSVSFSDARNMLNCILDHYQTNRLDEIKLEDPDFFMEVITVLLWHMASNEQGLIEFVNENREVFEALRESSQLISRIIPAAK